MSRRFTVMGFTEAELGFVLAAFFAAVGAAYLGERAVEVDARTRAEAATQVALRQRDSVAAALDRLRDSIRKKSNLTPPCSERGESSAPVAELTVLGADRYFLAGVEMSFAEVTSRLGAYLARGRSLGCRYSVRVVALEGVDAPIYSRATGQLRSMFYVRER